MDKQNNSISHFSSPIKDEVQDKKEDIKKQKIFQSEDEEEESFFLNLKTSFNNSINLSTYQQNLTQNQNKQDRILKINLWLQELFNDMPYYKKDEESILVLEQEMKEYRKKEAIYYQVNQYYQQKSEEYVEQSIKLKKKLQMIHLLDEDLSNIGQLCLNSLVELSILLDTKDVDIENLQLAISYYQIELFNQENEVNKIDNKLNQVEHIMKRIKFENGKLKDLKLNLETMNELIKHKTQTWKKDSFNLQLKANEYKKRVKFLKVDWENKNLDAKELRIKDLNKLKEQLIILESQLTTCHSKIKIYHELPPDLKLVRYQIEEKKELLKALLTEQEKLIEKLILF